MNIFHDFQDAIASAGLEPPAQIEPGKFYRFPGHGKRGSNRAGWCLLFDDGQAGCFGDWSSGFSEVWQAQRTECLSMAQRRAFYQQVQEARRGAEQERRNRQASAATRARVIWNAATSASANHPYLTKKQILPHGARSYRDLLVLPVMDFSHQLISLQFVSGTGAKRLLTDGRKQGGFIPVAGSPEHFTRVIICEGWATGCTLAEEEPLSLVLAAIDAGNLKNVAVLTRQHWPSARIVIAGDDDRLTEGNPGEKKAKEAATAAGGLLALPQWPANAPSHLTDFNDLAVWLRGGFND